MENSIDYDIDCISPEETKKTVNHFNGLGMKVSVDGNRLSVYSYEQKRGRYWIDSAEDFMEIVAEDFDPLLAELNRDFSFDAVWCTWTCGECMNFRIHFKDGEYSAEYSDWYDDGDLAEFEKYEDFVENVGDLCTEEEYYRLREKQTFILETEYGNVLSLSVPLSHQYPEKLRIPILYRYCPELKPVSWSAHSTSI